MSTMPVKFTRAERCGYCSHEQTRNTYMMLDMPDGLYVKPGPTLTEDEAIRKFTQDVGSTEIKHCENCKLFTEHKVVAYKRL